MQSDASLAIVEAHHGVCIKPTPWVFAYVSYSNISLLCGLWLCPRRQGSVFEWWCFEAGQTDVRRQIAYARAPTPTYSAGGEMIDARANFKLCELNSCYQRQWWVTGAQLEGPDKTCTHLCFHAFHALSTAACCKMFNNDGVLMIDQTEWRAVGDMVAPDVAVGWWYRYQWG